MWKKITEVILNRAELKNANLWVLAGSVAGTLYFFLKRKYGNLDFDDHVENISKILAFEMLVNT